MPERQDIYIYQSLIELISDGPKLEPGDETNDISISYRVNF